MKTNRKKIDYFTLREISERTGVREEIISEWFDDIQNKNMFCIEDVSKKIDQPMIELLQESLICRKIGISEKQISELLKSVMSRKERLAIIYDYAQAKINELFSMLDTIKLTENSIIESKEDWDIAFWGLDER